MSFRNHRHQTFLPFFVKVWEKATVHFCRRKFRVVKLSPYLFLFFNSGKDYYWKIWKGNIFSFFSIFAKFKTSREKIWFKRNKGFVQQSCLRVFDFVGLWVYKIVENIQNVYRAQSRNKLKNLKWKQRKPAHVPNQLQAPLQIFKCKVNFKSLSKHSLERVQKSAERIERSVMDLWSESQQNPWDWLQKVAETGGRIAGVLRVFVVP